MTASSSWGPVLDSLAAQIDLQERALLHGHAAPVDVEIEPPSEPLPWSERIRAIELFERCEHLLDVATLRIVANRSAPRSPYRGGGDR